MAYSDRSNRRAYCGGGSSDSNPGTNSDTRFADAAAHSVRYACATNVHARATDTNPATAPADSGCVEPSAGSARSGIHAYDIAQ